MVTPATIVTGAQGVSIASARLDAVGEALATRVSRRPARGPPRPRGCHADRTPAARTPATRVSRRPHARRPRGCHAGRTHAGRTRAASVARAAPPRPRGCHAGRTRAASATRAAPHAGAADHEHRLCASCQTVGTAAECVVTVRVISSLRVSVALKLCG